MEIEEYSAPSWSRFCFIGSSNCKYPKRH